MNHVLAIDVGTSSVKAAVVAADGSVGRVARRAQTFTAAADGFSEHDPAALVDNLIACAREALGDNAAQVQAVSVSVYQYGLLLLDAQCRPLGGMSTLLDRRGHDTFPAFSRTYDVPSIYHRTGGPAFAQAVLPRLFALSRQNPQQLRAAQHILSAKAWILYALSGRIVSEASTESASQCLNIHKQQWDAELLDPIGLKPGQFPDLVHPYRDPLPLTTEVRQKLGLPEHCRIVASLYDGGALCIGLNGMQEQAAVCNIGTSGMLRRVSNQLRFDPSETPLLQPFCLMDGFYLIGGAVNSAALNLQWLSDTVHQAHFPEAVAAANQVPPGSRGLFFLPYLTGERDPTIGEHGSAGFFGIRPQHRLPDLVRAAIEGVSFRLGMLATALHNAGIPFDTVRVGGGGILHFPVWQHILAGVLDATVQVSVAEEPALTGNAILGFLGCGTFSSMDEATAALIPPDAAAVHATPEAISAYRDLAPKFAKLSGHMAALYPLLAPQT